MGLEVRLEAAHNDYLALAEIIRQRLLGVELDESYSLAYGETPEGLLIDAHTRCIEKRGTYFAEQFDKAINDLISKAVNETVQKLNNVPHESLDSGFLLYNLRLCTVAEQTRTPIDRERLLGWLVLLFTNLDRHPRFIDLFGRLINCTGPALQKDEDELKVFYLAATRHERAAPIALSTLAKWNPEYLKTTVLPKFIHYWGHLARTSEHPNIMHIIESTLYHVLASINQKLRQDIASSIQKVVLEVGEEYRQQLHLILFVIFRKVNLYRQALEFDASYWSSLETISPWEDTLFSKAWYKLMEIKRRPFHALFPTSKAEKEIIIGIPVFSEGALALLFTKVLATLLDIKTKTVTIYWGFVPDALIHGNIHIGFYNPLIREHVELVHSNLLFTFTGYEVVVRRDRLRQVISRRSKSKHSNKALINVLSGQPLTDGQLKKLPDIQNELQELFEEAKVGVPENTDIEAKVFEFLGKFGCSPSIISLDEDSGMRRILLGQLDMYSGGANHIFYLTRNFPEDFSVLAVLATDIQHGSPNRLIVRNDFQNHFGISIKLLYNIWIVTMQIWHDLVECFKKNRSITADDLPVTPLSMYILREFNTNTEGRFTEFEELIQVLKEHTKITLQGKEPKYLKTTEDRLMREAMAAGEARSNRSLH